MSEQEVADILERAKVPLRVNMPSQGNFSAKTVARSLGGHPGAPEKISSMCGDA